MSPRQFAKERPMKRLGIVIACAAAVVGVPLAAAAKPAAPQSHKPGHPGTSIVAYQFVGTVVSVTPATTTTPARIVVHVRHVNRHAHTLVGTDVTFTITAKTKITKRGKAHATVANLKVNDVVHIFSRAPRTLPATFAGFIARTIHDSTK
jgi:hypothetical protein